MAGAERPRRKRGWDDRKRRKQEEREEGRERESTVREKRVLHTFTTTPSAKLSVGNEGSLKKERIMPS